MASDNASRLARVLDDYLGRGAAGAIPDRQALLVENPDMADSLRDCLASLEWIDAAAHDRGEIIGPLVGDLAAPAQDTLGDFRLLRVIARGGMGVVYEAEQQSLARRVALKILPLASMLDPRQRQRFLNEAHAAAQLNHPNIIDVIAVGCERGVHFYAMRLVDGPTLAQVIADAREASGARRSSGEKEITPPSNASQEPHATTESYHGQIPPERLDLPDHTDDNNPKSEIQNPKSTIVGLSTESPREYCRLVARLMIEVAQALDYAHQVGVIHRDVKPSNILLDGRGKAWVTDFGLARLETSSELTLTGDLLGTLRYMSPEQLLGQRAAVDHRTDVYSLGATLYELLTLRPAFAAFDRAELLRQISVESPRPPRKLNRSLPAELETITLKALEKSPADRYRTAGELADDLQRFLDHRPIQARRSRMTAHAKSIWRRYQVLLVAVMTTLLLATSVAGVLVWRQWTEAVEQRGLVVAREADLRRRLYAADIRGAHHAWQRGDVARAQELLDRYAGPNAEDLREFAWHYLSELLAARPAPITVLRPRHGNIYCVQFSPDGRHLAAACGDGHVEVWNVADWSPRHSLPAHQADADCVAFSPDGKLLASGGEDGWLRLWNVETGELIRSIEAGQKDTLTIAISPDDGTLAAGGIDGLVRFWQLPEGTPKGEYRASGGRVQHLAFSPDGTRLATAGGDSNAMIVEVSTHAPLFALPSQLTAAFAVAFSPQGDELALGSGTGLVALVDASSGRAESLLGIRTGQVRTVAFSPTARRLASAGASGVVDLWDTGGRSLLARFHGHEQRIWSLAFSPDGKQIASAGSDGSVHVWGARVESGLSLVGVFYFFTVA